MLKQPTIAEHKYNDHGEEGKKDEENMFVFNRLAQMHKRKVNKIKNLQKSKFEIRRQ